MRLRELQQTMTSWRNHNFPKFTAEEQFMGVVEEVGELSHALLKQKQGIRGTFLEHELNAQDSVGDILIFLTGLCDAKGWDLEAITEKTVNHVLKRDWQKNPTTGGQTDGP